MQKKEKEKGKPNPRIFSALVYEALKAESFDSLGEIAESVKASAARLQIPYDGDLVWAAIARVQAIKKAPLIRVPGPSLVARLSEGHTIRPAEATRIVEDLLARFGSPAPVSRRTSDWPEFFPDLVPV